MNLLAKKVKEIEMPDEMKSRIIQNCYKKLNEEMENKTMSKKTNNKFFNKSTIAVATFALCLVVTGVTALAASGHLKGFFKDITNWTGAVTGTSYEQATEEITVKVAEVNDELNLLVTFVTPDIAPYNSLDEFGIESYEIKNMSGKVLLDGSTMDMFEIVNGQANVKIPLENLAAGKYTLVIDAFVGSKKANQPLVIHGNWDCEFTR